MENTEQTPDELGVCPWCKTDIAAAVDRGQGMHATWCPHFREWQRFGNTEVESLKRQREMRVFYDPTGRFSS